MSGDKYIGYFEKISNYKDIGMPSIFQDANTVSKDEGNCNLLIKAIFLSIFEGK